MSEPTVSGNGDHDTSLSLDLDEERAGRSLMRDSLEQKTKTFSTQCPTPPPDTDPFPALNISEATPVAASDSHGVEHGGPSFTAGVESATTTTTANAKHETVVATPKPRRQSSARRETSESVRKLSASQMQALTSSPQSLPVALVPLQRKPNGAEYPLSAGAAVDATRPSMAELMENGMHEESAPKAHDKADPAKLVHESNRTAPRTAADFKRPPANPRTLSTPPINRRPSSGPPSTAPVGTRRNSFNPSPRPPHLNLNTSNTGAYVAQKAAPAAQTDRSDLALPSPILPSIPLPPMSLPTHLQLELAGQRPSPLYIHHSQAADAPYESSAVKFERLLNALLLPPYLEQILCFGTLACLDAWLYTFTILPMRFIIAAGVLVRWWAYVSWKEVRYMVGFVWQGTWRLWQRGRRGRAQSSAQSSAQSRARAESNQTASEQEGSQGRFRDGSTASHKNTTTRRRNISNASGASLSDHSRVNGNNVFHPPKHAMPRQGTFRHRRTKSMPSNLTSYHKADLLQGAVLICSSMALMNLDASRMYHFIRAQSSMKLYVVYNMLEVGDRLLSAIGQDILECLFSAETLSRNSSGRSKVLLPFGMFILSLIYNVIHTWCLFYQVITLNVAVNSYSNSLLTLLISNQFVEIKGSVFKKIEKENLFQLTCSDIVERFQTWIILLIIGMRNVVEIGGLSAPGAGSELDGGIPKAGPLHTSSVLPASFTVLPSWILSGEVLSPFLVVLGMEMMVDWIKHAYINKFNNVKPTLYNRMLDILCKDYYTNAFGTPSLTRRLGLPLLPLSCLFVRASIQVYHMFLATHLHQPIPTSTMDISVESSVPSSPAMVAALEHLDTLIRNALGRAVYGYPQGSTHARPFWAFSSDDAIALLTMLLFFFLTWVVLLIVKLLLGMVLLRYSRNRYAVMKVKEHAIAKGKAEPENYSQPGQRIGGWGAVEIGDDRRKWLYEDDPDGLKKMRDREKKTQERFRDNKADDGMAKVVRYEMIAKRIW